MGIGGHRERAFGRFGHTHWGAEVSRPIPKTVEYRSTCESCSRQEVGKKPSMQASWHWPVGYTGAKRCSGRVLIEKREVTAWARVDGVA